MLDCVSFPDPPLGNCDCFDRLLLPLRAFIFTNWDFNPINLLPGINLAGKARERKNLMSLD